jgi:hypothetical protein
MERNAAIANTVIVAALKALTKVAQHGCAGVEQRPAGFSPIVERAFDDSRNGELFVYLLEGVIARARVAWVFGDAPIVSFGDHSRDRRTNLGSGSSRALSSHMSA